MIIKNSFIQVVAPFLSCVTNEIVLVDIRKSLYHFDGSIKKLIEKEKPDVVMIFYSCSSFNSSDKDRLYLHKFD